jgi:PIN domain nuclease of toxin-antitoxin system
VILLDKHIWFWWVRDVNQLTPQQRTALSNGERDGLGVSVISCWEVAMLVAKKRLALSVSATDWVRQALRYPGIRQLRLTPNIAVASTELRAISIPILPTGSSSRLRALTTCR